MNLRCFYCQTPFTLGMEEKIAALRKMHAEDLHHYDAICPRCRRANSVSRERLEMFTPGWEEAIGVTPGGAAAPASSTPATPAAPMSDKPAPSMTRTESMTKTEPAPARSMAMAKPAKPAARKRHAPAAKKAGKKPAAKKSKAKPASKSKAKRAVKKSKPARKAGSKKKGKKK
jgi:hypothetical protein